MFAIFSTLTQLPVPKKDLCPSKKTPKLSITFTIDLMTRARIFLCPSIKKHVATWRLSGMREEEERGGGGGGHSG